MNTLHSYISDYGAAVFLYMLGLLFAVVIAYQMVQGQPINQVATGYIGLVIGYAINSHGISQGVSQTNDTVNKTAQAQAPLLQAQEARTVAGENATAVNSGRLDVLEQEHQQPKGGA